MEFQSLALSQPAEKVLQVDIARPKKLNSMNSDFWVEWEQLFEAIADDPQVRAVVCSAQGEKMFSAGKLTIYYLLWYFCKTSYA